ncbi:type II secretion system protein GspC, partial [Thermodesulfobacteriota bacterium]
LNLIFITAAIYLSVKTFYKIAEATLYNADPSAGVSDQVSSARDENRRPISFYRSVSERNLFDTKRATEEENRVDVESLKKTDLNLKLWGTVTGDKSSAYAVIEDPQKRKQNLYRIGDKIKKATVKMILRERVVLFVNGQDEILEIEKVAGDKQKGKIARKRSVETRSRSRSRKISMKRSRIEDAPGNVNELMQQVKIQPHFEDGEPDGLQLSNIKPSSIFRRMGLRNGDVISAVDGKKIHSVDDAMELYNSMQSASNFKLEIKRRGRSETMDYSFK